MCLVKMQTSRFGVDTRRELVARSDVVASLALRSKSWTWIVKTRRKGRWNKYARKSGKRYEKKVETREKSDDGG